MPKRGQKLPYRVSFSYPENEQRAAINGNIPKSTDWGARDMAQQIARRGGTATVIHVEGKTKTELDTYSPAGVPREPFNDLGLPNPVLPDAKVTASAAAESPVLTVTATLISETVEKHLELPTNIPAFPHPRIPDCILYAAHMMITYDRDQYGPGSIHIRLSSKTAEFSSHDGQDMPDWAWGLACQHRPEGWEALQPTNTTKA